MSFLYKHTVIKLILSSPLFPSCLLSLPLASSLFIPNFPLFSWLSSLPFVSQSFYLALYYFPLFFPQPCIFITPPTPRSFFIFLSSSFFSTTMFFGWWGAWKQSKRNDGRSKKRKIKEEWIALSLCLSSSGIAEGEDKIHDGLDSLSTHTYPHTDEHTVTVQVELARTHAHRRKHPCSIALFICAGWQTAEAAKQ